MKTGKKREISNGVKITIKNFQKKIPINPKRIKQAILKALSSEGCGYGEIAVSIVNEGAIRELNKKYMGRDYPTDVLSFDISAPHKPKSLSADIIISADEAVKNSKIYATSPSYELNLYAAHGILHLLGYDDHTRKDSMLMRKKERKYADT